MTIEQRLILSTKDIMCTILNLFGESRTAYISRFPEEFPFYTIKVAAGFPPAAALIVL